MSSRCSRPRSRSTPRAIPWNGPIAAVRVGRVEDNWVLNPTFQQLEFIDIDMIVAGSRDSIVMVEGGALEVSEADVIEALRWPTGRSRS